jgi:hypothetical protein
LVGRSPDLVLSSSVTAGSARYMEDDLDCHADGLLPDVALLITSCVRTYRLILEIDNVCEEGKRAYLSASNHPFTTSGSFGTAMSTLNECFLRSSVVALPSVLRKPSWQPFALAAEIVTKAFL